MKRVVRCPSPQPSPLPRPWVPLGLALLLLAAQGGCFTDLAVPSCGTPADCPAEYTACSHAHCFFRNTGCEQAAPVSGDGCCSGWEADRTEDRDCRTFDLTLEATEFSLPAIRSSDGMLFLHARSSRDGLIHLLQVSSRGDLLWDLPLGPSDLLLPPLLWDDGTLMSPVGTGVQVVDATRRQAVNLLSSPAPAAPLCAAGDLLAWVDREGSVHLYRPATDRRIRLAKEGDGLPPVHVRQAAMLLVPRLDGSLRGLSPEATSEADARTGSLDLGTPLSGPPAVTGDRVLMPTATGTLVAVSLTGSPWRQAWQVDLGGPVRAPPLVDSRGRILAVREDGTLFVIRETGEQGAVAGSHPLPGAGSETSLLVGETGRLLYVLGGRLRSLLLREDGGGVTFGEGFSLAVGGQRGLPSLVERRLVLALDNGHLVGLVSHEESDPGSWPRPFGDGANRMGNP